MANLSDAYGTFIISKEIIQHDFSTVELLLSAMKNLSTRSEYGVFPDDNIEVLFSKLREAKEAKTELEITFLGTGRWELANCIAYFFEYLAVLHPITEFTAFSKPNQTLIFDFVDFEPCLDIFYTGKYEISLQKTERTWETTVESEERITVPMTAKYLVSYGIYETAYDETNLSTLLDNDVFIAELSRVMPKNDITLHFLQTFWKENWISVLDESALLESIEDIVEFYQEEYE
ncbi:hypothetical protein [Listeria seeligeri]|uniref:hypothetical protein n=1 Tax=Listeria seeligeri TaxID=1640 RepID=UPI0022EBBB91|nr:hypothetical protein [Listeria seeligeri]